MKRVVFFLIMSLVFASFAYAQDNEPGKLLSAAIYEEEINGNLEEAIRLYEDIVNRFPEERSVVAEALYRNGLANEKLGNLKARQYYENVIKNYSDQSDMVRLAQIRLNRISKTDLPETGKEAKRKGLYVTNLYDEDANIREATMLDDPSLSPDGSKVVGIDYTIGQNVAVYGLLTKQIELITNDDWGTKGQGWTYHPAWSYDGKKIAYLFSDWNDGKGADYELRISTLDGNASTLFTNPESAGKLIPRQWSDDGESILTFIQDSTGFYTITLVSVMDGSIKPIHKTMWNETFPRSNASLSPDGRFIVFSDGPADNLDLYIVDTKGGAPMELIAGPTSESEPLWSPDGKHIAFIKETKGESLLYTQELTEGKPSGLPVLKKAGMQNIDLRNWTDDGICCSLWLDMFDIYTLMINPETGAPTGKPAPLDYTPMGSNTIPEWSHNGKFLAFLSFAEEPEVVILPVDGGEAQYYPISAPGIWSLSVGDLHWLPDDSGLGFSTTSPTENWVVYLLNLESASWQNWILPIEGWSRTDWGPDENSFVYSTNTPSSALYQFNIETKKSHKIYEADSGQWYIIRGLEFSPDRKKLAYVAYPQENNINEIRIFDLESGENRKLCENHSSPTFSKDGQYLLTLGRFEEGEKKSMGVVIFSIDGEVLHQYDLAKYFSSDTRFTTLDCSPDSKKLIFGTRVMKNETSLIKNVLE